MKLSISDIGWTAEQDKDVYELMQCLGFKGLEIAPTRIFPSTPYEKKEEAKVWSRRLSDHYGLSVSSMQSIWYGVSDRIFGDNDERTRLIEYTKKAVDFAASIKCGNLVFGCPKNRDMPEGTDPQTGITFFHEIGEYAYQHGTVIGMEANPPIYNTSYVNTTSSAIELIRNVDSNGFRLNLDVGTIIANAEDINELDGNIDLINHVHISEPMLRPIEKKDLHKNLVRKLISGKYDGYISIEMGKGQTVSQIDQIMEYVRGIFY